MKNRKVVIVLLFLILGVLLFLFLRRSNKKEVPKKIQVEVENQTAIPEDPSLKKKQPQSTEKNEAETIIILTGLELPKCDERKIVHHVGFSLEYDEPNEQAKWVAYQLTETETVKRFSRSDNFRSDAEISTGSATDQDYKRSGYDRGHLAPAADMGWSSQTMSESFYYSNMSPQEPGFNRGIWKRLEEQVRSWAVELDTIYVVTGPVLSGKMSFIGPERVAVPNYYYKVILYAHGKDSKMIGFVLPNASSQSSLMNYVVTVDSLEKLTGLDFYPGLQDTFENSLERTICASCWSWTSSKSRTNETLKVTVSVQCSGITRAGKRCKRKTRNPSGRCYQHE